MTDIVATVRFGPRALSRATRAWIGSTVTVYADFADGGTPYAVSGVALSVTRPDGSTAAWSEGDLTAVSTGTWSLAVTPATLDQLGDYVFVATCTSPAAESAAATLRVLAVDDTSAGEAAPAEAGASAAAAAVAAAQAAQAATDAASAAAAVAPVALAATQITRTGGATPRPLATILAEHINVRDYGAAGDGVTDDTSAFAAAWNAALAGAASAPVVVRIPPGHYRITAPLPTITRAIRIEGAGRFLAWLVMDEALNGSLIQTSECWAFPARPDTSTTPASEKHGLHIEGMTILGSRDALYEQTALDFRDRNDDMTVRDVTVYFVKGRGISIGRMLNVSHAYIRESRFYNVEVRHCGDGATPAVDITSTGTGAADATNEVEWHGLKIIHGWGVSLRIAHENGFARGSTTRAQRFYGLHVEGRGGSGIAGPLMRIEGAVGGVHVYGLSCNASPVGDYGIHIRDLGGAAPVGVSIQGSFGTGDGGVWVEHGARVRMVFDEFQASATALKMSAGVTGVVQVDVLSTGGTITTDIDSSVAHLYLRAGPTIAQLPNGGVSGGNIRGTGAVDWQQSRSDAAHVAGGAYSVIAGGRQNRAAGGDAAVGGGVGNISAGFYSVVAGGQFNNADGRHSWVPGGTAAAADVIGKGAWAAGNFSVRGDAQSAELSGSARTTDATQTRLTADRAAAGALNTFNQRANATCLLRMLVVARQTAGSAGTAGDSAGWLVDALVRRGATAATTTLVAGGGSSIAPTHNDAGAATWRLAVAADTTNGGIAISGTGEANKTIQWVARLLAVETVG